MNNDRLIFGIVLFVATILLISPTANQHAFAWHEEFKITASDAAENGRFGESVSISGNRAIVGARGDDHAGSGSGSAYLFDFDGTSWTETGKLTASDAARQDSFGSSVSISATGNTVIVGASGNDDAGSQSGSAYLFDFDGTSWTETGKLTASDAASYAYFGNSVSISATGNTVIVGAVLDDGTGSAYLFKKIAGVWTETAKLTASDATSDDSFGHSVSISTPGNTVIVGAYGHDDAGSKSGSAYIFDFNGTSWTETAKLTASDAADGDRFGQSVSISDTGNIVIVGANGNDDAGTHSGSAYLFDFDGNTWTETAKLTASDPARSANFGWSVSISATGNTIIVGASGDDDAGSFSGSAYRFAFDGTSWTETGKFTASDAASYDFFGGAVSISDAGNTVIVGAVANDDGGDTSGSAYIVDLDRPSWGETQLTASDAAGGDVFGVSVSISGHRAIVGASGDDDAGSSSGAAYLFDFDGTSWNETAKITASDAKGKDWFGGSVSLSETGNRVIVGAWGNDDVGSGSGSAYIFDFDGNTWTETAKLTASDAASYDYFGQSVSISGDRAIVGAAWDDDAGYASGSAYIFDFNGTSWNETAKITASDAKGKDWFGQSVSISGDRAIVGAWGNDDVGSGSGSAYIFDFDGNTWTETVNLTASDAGSSSAFGWSVSISETGNRVIVGAVADDAAGFGSGSAYIFDFTGTSWVETAKIVASDAASGEYFGMSVSISETGNRVIVGVYTAQYLGIIPESAYIFDFDGTTWTETVKLTAPDAAGGDGFGWFVSLTEKTGNKAIVGAWGNDDAGGESGSAYIFDLDGNPLTWTENNLTASDAAGDDRFGKSVSIAATGNRAIVGAPGNDDAGSAYIVDFESTSWTETAKLRAADAADGDWFGRSVSISAAGNSVIVGAYLDDDAGGKSGSAYIFDFNGTIWTETAKLTASDAAGGDRFGISVSISEAGNRVIVGAYCDDDVKLNSGSAYIFEKIAGVWTQTAKITASDPPRKLRGIKFGESVSISGAGNRVIVGAKDSKDKGISTGSAYLFEKIAGVWTQTVRLTASDQAYDDIFGQSVSISGAGNRVIVGARDNWDPSSASTNGSAYIFDFDGTSWTETAKLIASDASISDKFGNSVSISGIGNTVIVGARSPDYAEVGPGAAYLFDFDGISWTETAKLTASDAVNGDRFGISVSISHTGHRAIVGADGKDDAGSESGSAYILD